MMDVLKWGQLLSKLGVGPGQVSAWASVFASSIDDMTFGRVPAATLPDEAGNPVKLTELALFLGQALHECDMLTSLSENLNYKPDALLATFNRGTIRITQSQAQQYGRTADHPADQKAIANIVYGGQWGLTHLGNTQPTDGWDFRGSGLIQMTGRDNFVLAQKDTGIQFVSNPDLMRSVGTGPLKATISWWHRKIGATQLADTTILRKTVNTAGLGLDHCNAIALTASQFLSS